MIPDLLSILAKALAFPGFNPWQPTRRRHSRMYTKRYADGRQKKGGGLWAKEQRRLGRLPARPAQSPDNSTTRDFHPLQAVPHQAAKHASKPSA